VGEGDLPAQAHRRATEREEAPGGLGDAEARRLAGDADVGGLEDLGAAGERGALDRGDERLLQAVAAEEGFPVQLGLLGEAGGPLVVGVAADIALRSAPAEKWPPAPVRMATRTSSSPSMRSQASARRTSISAPMALRASGRFMVTVTTCPSRSTRRCGLLLDTGFLSFLLRLEHVSLTPTSAGLRGQLKHVLVAACGSRTSTSAAQTPTSRGSRTTRIACLRKEAPVHFFKETGSVWSPGVPRGPGYWALTKYADIVAVSKDPARFSSARGGTNIEEVSEEDLSVIRLLMVNMDPPITASSAAW
jgi:hypothetical protein